MTPAAPLTHHRHEHAQPLMDQMTLADSEVDVDTSMCEISKTLSRALSFMHYQIRLLVLFLSTFNS
jgi:hypothetical protein